MVLPRTLILSRIYKVLRHEHARSPCYRLIREAAVPDLCVASSSGAWWRAAYRYQMRAGKNQQLHLMAEEIRQRIESLRKENHQQRQWLDVRITFSDGCGWWFWFEGKRNVNIPRRRTKGLIAVKSASTLEFRRTIQRWENKRRTNRRACRSLSTVAKGLSCSREGRGSGWAL